MKEVKKKEILNRMSKILNENKKRNEKTSKEEMEKIIEAFRQVILNCIENGEDFNYHGFIEVETTPIEEQERMNPKTQKTFIDHKKYKVNIRFTYSIKQFIKKLKVKEEKENDKD